MGVHRRRGRFAARGERPLTAKFKTVSAPRRDAHAFVGKAKEFLQSARTELEARRADASMLAAVHAAISACDAVTVALAGRCSADSNHSRAADLLEQVAGDSQELEMRARQLRALLSKKHHVEYEARRGRIEEARDACERAARFVEWATEVVARAI